MILALDAVANSVMVNLRVLMLALLMLEIKNRIKFLRVPKNLLFVPNISPFLQFCCASQTERARSLDVEWLLGLQKLHRSRSDA